MKISWFLIVSHVEIPFQQHCEQFEGFFFFNPPQQQRKAGGI